MRFTKFQLPAWVAGGLLAVAVTSADAQSVPVVPNVPQEDAYQLRALPPQEAAQEAASPEEEGPSRYLETEFLTSRGIKTYGWIDAGIGANAWGAPWNGPVTFNDRAWQGMMNQLYLVNERTMDLDANTVDWGGRVDLLYGTDYLFTAWASPAGIRAATTAWRCRSCTVRSGPATTP
jgi:hypothetical protein